MHNRHLKLTLVFNVGKWITIAANCFLDTGYLLSISLRFQRKKVVVLWAAELQKLDFLLLYVFLFFYIFQ